MLALAPNQQHLTLPNNIATSTTKFLYKYIWCRFGCPIELVSDQGTHFRNKIVNELSTYYAVVHKKSTSYYPQANVLVESINKTLQMILRKIDYENRTYWNQKLNSALWTYRTSYKTVIKSTPFRMTFGLEAVMLVEFQVPTLRVQVIEILDEEQSERVRKELLLVLEESRLWAMCALEQKQRQTTTFVDRHRCQKEMMFVLMVLGLGLIIMVIKIGIGLGIVNNTNMEMISIARLMMTLIVMKMETM